MTANLEKINNFLLKNKLLIYLLVILLLFIKETKQFIYPQFWAEDGVIFFAQAFMEHWKSIFFPYAGYLHFIPRVVANIAIIFPYRYAPTIFAYAALLALLFVIYQCLNQRLNMPYKSFIALSIILVPSFGEVFMALTWVQWILALVLFMYAFYRAPVNIKETCVDALIIFILGLTGPFIFVVYPLYVWRFIKDRDTVIWLIVATLACLIQIIFAHIIFHTTADHVHNFNSTWLSDFGGRFFANFFYYAWWHHAHPNIFLALLAFIFPVVLVLFIIPKQYKVQAICIYYFWFIVILLMFLRIGGVAVPAEKFIDGDRYVYLPTVMIAWLLILGLKNHGKKFVFAVVFLILMLVESAFMFPDSIKNSVRNHDFHWVDYSEKIKPGVKLTIPENPVRLDTGASWEIKLN